MKELEQLKRGAEAICRSALFSSKPDFTLQELDGEVKLEDNGKSSSKERVTKEGQYSEESLNYSKPR